MSLSKSFEEYVKQHNANLTDNLGTKKYANFIILSKENAERFKKAFQVKVPLLGVMTYKDQPVD